MWVNNSGDYITNTQFIFDIPDNFNTWDISSCWKSDQYINYGYPFISLMLNLPSLHPLSFLEFVNSLFSVPDTNFDDDFKTKIKLIDNKKVQEFVQSLLNYLHEKSVITPPQKYLESEIGSGSFFDYVQNNSDIDLVINTSDYWNESVQNLISYFNQHFNNSNNEQTINYRDSSIVYNGIIPINSSRSFNSKDIKNADAGNLFTRITNNVWAEIVRPWYNLEWQSYYAVRNNGDAIDNAAASSDSNLTFTRRKDSDEFEDALNNWIRLIMPNNSRRVSIEDLNRNFWVISSTTQAVCSYIWGSYSPIPYLFKGILNELAQLWENILYLWVAYNLISQKGGRGIKTIIMPLPRTEYQPYRKYDDFITGFPSNIEAQSEFVIQRTMPIIQKYKYTNLCILLYTRVNNYYNNYYAAETYRSVVFYNCRTEKVSYIPLEASLNNLSGFSVYFNPANFKESLYAIRETKTYYKWSYPLSNISNIIDNDGNTYVAKRFYGAYRIIPEIEVGYDHDELCIKSLKLTAIDAAAKSLFGKDRKMVSYTLRTPIKESSEKGILAMKAEENDSENLGNFDIYDGIVQQAYYLGELPSCTALSKSQPYFIYDDSVKVIGEGKLIKIGNYLPKKFHDEEYDLDANYYGNQVPPDGTGTTDYLLNLTITGGHNNTTKVKTQEIYYGKFGSANVVSSSKCYFYKPKITSSGGNISYSLTCDRETADTMNEEKYRTVGISVISDHIAKVSQPTTITYYVAGVGIQPWHNKPQNDTFQGYWTTTMLTHMYRYVPKIPNDYTIYLSAQELNQATEVYKNGAIVGYLQVLGIINKREAAFSVKGNGDVDNTFTRYNNLTTWRLPQLIPEKKAQGYIILKEQATGELYFVDPDESPELETIFVNQGGAAVATTINNDFSAYADQLITEENFKFELQNPSGRWCVFDGNTSTGHSTNKKGDVYTNQRDRREVAYTNFSFSNGKLQLAAPTQGRLKNTTQASSWFNCEASYILPNGGFTNMVFSW